VVDIAVSDAGLGEGLGAGDAEGARGEARHLDYYRRRLRAITPLVVPADLPCAIPRTASCTYRACAWRWVKRADHNISVAQDAGDIMLPS